MILRSQNTVIAAMMVRHGDADAMLAGPVSLYRPELLHVLDVIGLKPGVISAAAMQVLILDKGVYFITDTHVVEDPTPEEICQATVLAAEHVERFGMRPRIALLSSSNFGSNDFTLSVKMRNALKMLHERAPNLEAEGEMHADTALMEEVRTDLFPKSRLFGEANTLVMPDLTSANVAYSLAKALANGISVGPILLGLAAPAHVLTASTSVRGVLNMTALAAVEAQARATKTRIAEAVSATAD